MKYIFIFIFSVIGLFLKSQTYCAATPTATPTGIAITTSEDEIYNFSILGTTLNSSSDCNTTLPAPSVQWRYSSYVGTTHFLPFGTYTVSLTRGTDCNGAHGSSAGAVVFIDLNSDGDWLDANERVTVLANSINQGSTVTGVLMVPNTASVGLTRLRVMMGENMDGATQAPCSNYTWGETEDYTVFIGAKKYDYEATQMFFPDTLGFCADAPNTPVLKVTNVGNQDMDGGRVELSIKGIGSSTTNILTSKVFTQTISPGGSAYIDLPTVTYPLDETLEFKFNVYNSLDTLRGNDTLKKIVNAYKTPTFTLQSNTVCLGDSTTVSVLNLSKPSFVKWDNQAITETTKYKLPATRDINVEVSRAWKCTKYSKINAVVLPLPNLSVSNDTVLCRGQAGVLKAFIDNTTNSLYWNNPTISTTQSILVSDIRRFYTVTATGVNGCLSKDSVFVDTVNVPFYSKINDTICKGETALVGLNTPNGFLYDWNNMEDNTPLIHPIPSKDSVFKVMLSYNNCHKEESVDVKVLQLPKLTALVGKELCPNDSTTIVVSGAKTYSWSHSLGANTTVKVSPATSTVYSVLGTDSNNCVASISSRVVVNPKPELTVYSNKYLDNVCLGDSAIIFVNGANTYIWDNGKTDSILRLTPTITQQYKVIGSSNKGCKDTVDYRLTVKSALNVITKGKSACEGESVTLEAKGGASYNWGIYGTDSISKPIVASRTSSYTVTVTSAEKCQVVANVLLEVQPKPQAQVNSIVLCKGVSGKLEASGGSSYKWSTAETDSIISVSPSSTTNYMVEVSSKAGCKDTVYGLATVIPPREINFKSPVHFYDCPNLPVTMIATPVGGVFSGKNVEQNIFRPQGLEGTITITYTIIEPINNCKEIDTIEVMIKKCSSSISQINEALEVNVYPNPFKDRLTISMRSDENSDAQISLYDFSGRKVVVKNQRILVGENKIELNDLNTSIGVYFLEIETEKINRQFKLVKE